MTIEILLQSDLKKKNESYSIRCDILHFLAPCKFTRNRATTTTNEKHGKKYESGNTGGTRSCEAYIQIFECSKGGFKRGLIINIFKVFTNTTMSCILSHFADAL